MKVSGFSSVMSGSYAAVLGDLGADAVKVESLMGNLARWWGHFFAGEGGLFQGWNRNKRGISVNLRSDAGREIAHALVRESDIVVEDFRAQWQADAAQIPRNHPGPVVLLTPP